MLRGFGEDLSSGAGAAGGRYEAGQGNSAQALEPRDAGDRDGLADRFHGLLTPQDEHRPQLHVTVQNKVSIEEAKALQVALAPQVLPRDFTFRGLALHAYRDGPWEFVKSWPFRG